MSGAERDAGKAASKSTAEVTQTSAPPDYVGWFAGAAQRMLLQRADIKQYVANHGRLQNFDTEMADWGVRFNGTEASLTEGSEVLFGICERFELLKFVGKPRSGGPASTRGAVRGAHDDDARLPQLRLELARAYSTPE